MAVWNPVLADPYNAPNPPLRHTEPLEAIVADLEQFIPTQMESSGIPGLAIALVHEGRVVWAAGFGVANRFAGSPVTPETVFEVASNSKVVTAYAALRLVDQGRLALDESLAASLVTPWLPPSSYAERITLRHVASHSSGLTDSSLGTVSKAIAFEPGSAFRYSGAGFLYMQEALEQVTDSSLEELARRLVFEPLGMESSSFAGRADLEPRLANGHIVYAAPLLIFLVPFTGLLLFAALAGSVARRIRAGTWRLSKRLMVGSAIVAASATLALQSVTLGRGVPNLVLLSVLAVLVLVAALALASFLMQTMIGRLASPPTRRRLHVLGMLALFVMLLGVSGMLNGPIPNLISPSPTAVGSLRATAPDLAAFLAEVASPRLLTEDTAIQLRTPQVAINEHFSWGLGIGIQHSDQGDALWQNGVTPGFRSVMVIYPEHAWGVVVLTNSDNGAQLANDVAARALGGVAHWPFF
jgi:CubicO group peptidase (beta-lactamase class C family)